ncbi:MAG: glycosyltransferase family 4 protein [Candidatus Levybacteria bacterium]|nr:glycosyltransferase family 4 protein [Candidatus Levybacteria bacterium]
MRIAILGSIALPVPPPFQGGTEWIAYYQAKGLSEKGHKVLLFAPGESRSYLKNLSVDFIEVGEGNLALGSNLEKKIDPRYTEASRKLRLEAVGLSEVIKELIERKDEYDLILNNIRGEAVFVPIAKYLNKKFVNVMHLNIFDELADLFKHFSTNIITISNSQRKNYPQLSYLDTVYNGVDTNIFSFSSDPHGYFLMMGSIGRHKNQKIAIKIAKRLKIKLIIAGKIRDNDYFEEIKRDIDGEMIKWIGEIDLKDKVKLYQGAKALLFPILWEEPFGLVMIEAMSCGTPVIAFNNGAVSEVLINNKTGFVIESDSQMIEAIHKIDSINRVDCRKHVEDKFTIEKMVDNYEKSLLKLD